MTPSPSLTLALVLLLGALAVPGVVAAADEAADAVTPLAPERIRAVAAMLPAKPAGPGRPIADRAAWEALAAQPHYRKLVERAEALRKQPLPEQTDEQYLEFSRTGHRVRFQNLVEGRRGRLTIFVLAECAENKGRFLPAIEELIEAVCEERTWVLPAADEKLKNFHGEITEIDLWSSKLGWNLGLTDYLLGERLRPAVRETLRANVRRRVFEPYLTMIRGQSRPVYLHGNRVPSRTYFWLKGTNNWNAVCQAGIVGAALAMVESREARAEFVVAAETYTRYFLSGFTDDGYCSEGLGYWNYGFGHYLMLSETVRGATGGKLDLLAAPGARKPATFPARIQILGEVAPAFADCAVLAKPAAPAMYVLDRRLDLGLAGYGPETAQQVFANLFETLIYGVEAAKLPPASRETATAGPGLRDWFDKAGVLIARPSPGSGGRFGVALKGGHNAEHHNHNDLGSFVVVSGGRPVLLDPGSETYTARTFSPRRYESKLLNSFGHPVPVVADTLQQKGRKAEARIVRTDFTDAADTMELDLTSAYPVADLRRLHRTFVYSRAAAGSLTVTDRVGMAHPQTFGTALLTLGKWERQPDGSLLIFDGGEALRVVIDTGGRDFAVEAEEIHEDAPAKPTRIGITLKEPVTDAVVTLTITPAAPP